MFHKVQELPRAGLLSGPTPIEPLRRLADHLRIDLWMKRDDLTGLGFGGNKIRQLEFYLGDALARSADTLLITGAVQSNYVRCAAAAGAKHGMRTIIQLEERVPGKNDIYRTSGNVLLGQILQAEFMHYPLGEDEAGADRALHERAERLNEEGRSGYVIPLAMSERPMGALGYMMAAKEIIDQTEAIGRCFDAIVVPSGSGMTHAGLLAGLRDLGCRTPVYGICVRRPADIQAKRIASVTQAMATWLDSPSPVVPADIELFDSALSPGYGLLGPNTRNAIRLMASLEGQFLDPVYSAKCFAGLLDLVECGKIEPSSRILFLHTGGLPALFAYSTDLS